MEKSRPDGAHPGSLKAQLQNDAEMKRKYDRNLENFLVERALMEAWHQQGDTAWDEPSSWSREE